ncbi:MAG: hypothetical protein LUQ50_07565 [Methanospirillum sp.]|uniref:hypothetical protein n=1 Tax=Methanospirillum sp. TaxID=45200 RepID=UPI0023719602|nr:hypothetical protein [Methanospirillum sp.]MDD1728912.1 hypothetical protein [Methanospirillum sp.]
MRANISEIKQRIRQYNLIPDNNSQVIDQLSDTSEFTLLYEYLTSLSQKTPRPFILLIDEIDTLVGDSLISALRQIRSGYDKRPEYFPSSVILCGVRDIRDYRIHSDSGKSVITGVVLLISRLNHSIWVISRLWISEPSFSCIMKRHDNCLKNLCLSRSGISPPVSHGLSMPLDTRSVSGCQKAKTIHEQ